MPLYKKYARPEPIKYTQCRNLELSIEQLRVDVYDGVYFQELQIGEIFHTISLDSKGHDIVGWDVEFQKVHEQFCVLYGEDYPHTLHAQVHTCTRGEIRRVDIGVKAELDKRIRLMMHDYAEDANKKRRIME